MRSLRRFDAFFIRGLASLWPLLCACQDAGALPPIPGGFDPAQRIASGVQVRLSEKGLGTLSDIVGKALTSAMPDGLEFPIPPQCNGDTRICCADPDPGCKAAIALKSSTLSAQEPRGVRFVLRASLLTSSAVSRFIPVHATLLGIGVDCHAAVDTARSGKNDIGLTGRLVLNVDPQSELTRVSVEGASVIDFDDGDFELTGGLACSIANLVKPLIINIVVDQLSSSISGLVEQQLCAKCPGTRPFEDECGSEATSCAKGLCMEGDRCLQRLGIEGRMDVGSLLEGLGLKAGGVLDLSLLAGGFAMSKNEGLGLGVLAGLSPTSEAAPTCVPEVGAPTIENVPPDQAILGDVEAPVEHDLLLGVHVSVLDRLGWTLYRSGALCLDVEEGVLDTSLIGALLPSLGRLLDRRPVPVKVSLRPTKPPTFALGANTFDSQTGELTAPLVVLKLENAKIELQALVHERFVRIAQVHTDLTLPLGLRVDERGRLLPVPGDLSSLLSETNVELSGLLTEPPDAVSRLIQKAVDIFLPVLTDSLEAFQLPTLAGLELVVAQKGLSASADGSFLNVHAQLIPQQSRDAQTPTASCSTIPGSKGSKGLLIVVALVLLCSLRRKRGVSGTLVLLCAGLAALGACQSTPLGATDAPRGQVGARAGDLALCRWRSPVGLGLFERRASRRAPCRRCRRRSVHLPCCGR
ncbi:MAG: hypothetical protein MUC50_16400 [Myxococcota bacterium]|nr:hypothetical protein [Myxococcota bacterium]